MARNGLDESGEGAEATATMGFDHDPLLVVLSLLVATQASYVGLSLARDIPLHLGLRRRLQIVGAALSLAVGVWAMHFVGMLAAHVPASVDYAVLPTLISFLVCVLMVGAGVTLASLPAGGFLALGAALMGLGIVAMHYIGMQAVHAALHLEHDPRYVAGSAAIAVAASFLALWLAFAAKARPPLLLCAAILGLAISGMHYTAMAGVMTHEAEHGLAASAISRDFLAAIVSIVAFAVSGVFMLTLVPAQPRFNSPAVGAKSPAPAEAAAAPAPAGDSLRIILKGEPRTIAYHDIASIHANAHYTTVFNGAEEYFCPLSISEVMRQLPQEQFVRVHRSSIVRIGRVSRVLKSGDNGLAELDGPTARKVAVSRHRVAELKAQLERRGGQPAA